MLWFWLYILIPVLGVALLFTIIVISCCIVYKVNAKEINKVKEDNEAQESSDTSKDHLNSLTALEVPMSNIRFCEVIGEGAFGKVYRGDVLGLFGSGAITPVAVKTLKVNASQKWKLEFKREVELMAYLQHPNIICLLGVCINEQPMSMLFEYMECGDLHEYLILHYVNITDDNDDCDESLCLPDLLYISTQIAAGMDYLSLHHYIHRDLATRNCLVGNNRRVKISDFGLSRDIYSADYYRVQSKSLLPVRWMPPESILYGKFTSESDAWSFGVVLWEIFNFGLQPYYGKTNQEVIDMIRSRKLLPCPENCPPQIYGLMLQTWHALPSQRPTFRTLYDDLRSWFKVFSTKSKIEYPDTPRSGFNSLHRSTLDRSLKKTYHCAQSDLYTPWKPRYSNDANSPRTKRQKSPTSPHFIDERFEPRITVV